MKRVSSCPRASPASAIARPRNFVPPRIEDPQWNLCTARQTASAPNSSASTGIRSSAAWISFANAKSGRQLHRQEAVGLHARLREEAAVGDADLKQRHGNAFRIELADHPRERVEQAEIGFRRARVVADDLDLDVVSGEVVQLGDQLLGREARQRATVQLELDLARHDVDLLAAANDRRVDGVAQHRLELPGPRAEQAQRLVGQAWLQQRAQDHRLVPRQLGGDPLDRLAHDGRHVHGHPLAVEVGEEAAEPGDGTAAVDHRAVPAGPPNRRLQPADLLLGHLDRIEALAARRASVKPPNSPSA